MTTYTAYFRTDANFATREFEADTSKQALALTRGFYDDDPWDLVFESYAGGTPVNEIAICNRRGQKLRAWVDDDMRLRLAARDLLDAAELVVARRERGDLAAAVRELDAAIAKAKGGAQ
jgi:hypothetical protein